jgi:hypothetical protein
MSTAQQDITETMPEEDSGPDGDQGLSAGAELCKMLTADPVALLDMFIDTLRHVRDNAQLPAAQYHVVIIPDTGEGRVVTVDSLDEYLTVWRETSQKGGQAFGFRGDLLLPSKGGHYLVTPWGRFPLFAEDFDTEVDSRGYLGAVPPIPKAVPATAQSVPEDDDDEELADQEEDDDIEGDGDEDDVDDD